MVRVLSSQHHGTAGESWDGGIMVMGSLLDDVVEAWTRSFLSVGSGLTLSDRQQSSYPYSFSQTNVF